MNLPRSHFAFLNQQIQVHTSQQILVCSLTWLGMSLYNGSTVGTVYCFSLSTLKLQNKVLLMITVTFGVICLLGLL